MDATDYKYILRLSVVLYEVWVWFMVTTEGFFYSCCVLMKVIKTFLLQTCFCAFFACDKFGDYRCLNDLEMYSYIIKQKEIFLHRN